MRSFTEGLNNLVVEQGVWTPTIQDASFSDGEGQTYTRQIGYYTRVGETVLFHGSILVSSLGTLSSAVYLAGLPFASSDVTGINYPGSMYVGYGLVAAITAGQNITGFITENTTYVGLQVWDSTTGSTPMTVTELGDAANLSFAGQYRIAN